MALNASTSAKSSKAQRIPTAKASSSTIMVPSTRMVPSTSAGGRMAKNTEELELSTKVAQSGKKSSKKARNMATASSLNQMEERWRVTASMAKGKESGRLQILMALLPLSSTRMMN